MKANELVSGVLRATTALNVAVLEWENADINNRESFKAVAECQKRIAKLVRDIEKEDAR